MNFQKAIQFALASYNSGNLHQAKYFLKEVLKDQPNDAEILNFLGIIYGQLGNTDLSKYYIKNSLQINSSNLDAYVALGHSYRVDGQTDEAIACYEKVISLNPNYPEVYHHLGTIYQENTQINKAITWFQKALQLDPHLFETFYRLGCAYNEEGEHDKAISAFKKAININPKHILSHWARCMLGFPIIYADNLDINSIRENYYHNLLNLKITIPLESTQDIENAAEAVGTFQPFYLSYQGMNDRELQHTYGELVCNIMAKRYPEYAAGSVISSDLSEEPLRIGIVSGFFHLHAVWKIPIKGWIENIDKKKFAFYGYYTQKIKDHETEIARQSFLQFVEDVYSFEELCKIIRRDNLHVLIYPEIGMDPITLKLASLRLAPIQCASWGHADTSGLSTIDYFLSSELMEPYNAEDHYTENLIRLPNLSIYYTPMDTYDIEVNRKTFGLRQNTIIYHCFQTLYKRLPQYDDIFPRIAQQVGDCQFLFVSYPDIASIKEQFQIRIERTFNRYNLNAKDYVVFLPPVPPERYHALNRLADIYLDSIGWSGCNSILEALACNLPVVTLPTMLMRGREGFAILSMMGVTETIAATLEDYISLAIKLGKDSRWRQEVVRKISSHKHLVYHDRTCITALEDFLESVVKEKREQALKNRYK